MKANKSTRSLKISPSLQEAGRISYLDAMLILLSVAFGVGYLDLFDEVQNESIQIYPIVLQLVNLVVSTTACFMLCKVKEAHYNKMGSYQEISYYYKGDRTFIFVISLHVSISLLITAAYGFQFCTSFFTEFIAFQADSIDFNDPPLWLYAVVGAAISLALFPYSLAQNYQRFGKLTYIIVTLITLCFVLILVQIY